MRALRVRHWVVLSLLLSAVALILGADVPTPLAAGRDVRAATAAVVAPSVRLPDMVMRTDGDRDDGAIAALSPHGRALVLLAVPMSGLLALLARARRRLAHSPDHIPSPPRRSALAAPRAPPAFRLI